MLQQLKGEAMRTKILTIAMGCAAIGLAFVMAASAAVSRTTDSVSRHAAAKQRAGTIAFLRSPAGAAGPYGTGQSLYVIHADGSGLLRVTPQGTDVYTYAWSPNGSLIAYIDTAHSLWLIRPDGTGLRLLLPSSKLSTLALSWSPDGKRLAVATLAVAAAGPNPYSCGPIYIVPISGALPRSLPSGGAGCAVAWSPRGDEIAYNRGGISVIRPDGSGRRQVGPGGGPQWSADGKQLAFEVAVRLRNGNIDRYNAFAVVNADGKHFHVVTTHAYNEYGVAWSPRGRRILYGRAHREGIYVVGSDGRKNHRVTGDSPPQALSGALGWSPDGHSIVYTAGEPSNTDLYVIGVGGRGKHRLTSTADTDIDPSWVAPDHAAAT